MGESEEERGQSFPFHLSGVMKGRADRKRREGGRESSPPMEGKKQLQIPQGLE